MVDYQGPAVLRSLVEKVGVNFFNRVSSISFKVRDMNEVSLNREAIAKLEDLKQIAVWKLSTPLPSEADVDAVRKIVPPCLLGKVGCREQQDCCRSEFGKASVLLSVVQIRLAAHRVSSDKPTCGIDEL